MFYVQARLEANTENTSIEYSQWKKWYEVVYLASDYWLEKRKWFLEQYGYKCVGCGGKATQVHHWKLGYLNLWQETWKDCIPLCGQCHMKMHGLVTPKKRRELGKTEIMIDLDYLRDVSAKIATNKTMRKVSGRIVVDAPLPSISLTSKRKVRKISNV